IIAFALFNQSVPRTREYPDASITSISTATAMLLIFTGTWVTIPRLGRFSPCIPVILLSDGFSILRPNDSMKFFETILIDEPLSSITSTFHPATWALYIIGVFPSIFVWLATFAIFVRLGARAFRTSFR